MDDLTVSLSACVGAVLLLLENGAFVFWMDVFLEPKAKGIRKGVIFCGCVLACLLVDRFSGTVPISKILFLLLLLLSANLLYHGAQIRKIVYLSIYLAIVYVIDWGAMVAVQLIFHLTVNQVIETPWIFNMMALLSKLGLFLLTFFITKGYRVTHNAHLPWSILIMPNAVLLMSCLFVLVGIRLSMNSSGIQPSKVLVMILGVVIIDAMAVSWVGLVEKMFSEKARRQLLEQKQLVQIQSMESLKEAYAMQRKNAHEFNRHIGMLSELLELGRAEEAKQYLLSVAEKQTNRVLAVNSHNMIVDTIFNRYYYEAQKAGVDMGFSVNDLADFKMPAGDSVVLLSNLLENALEACMKVERAPRIEVQFILNAEDKEVFLSIRNTSLPVTITQGQIKSTKQSVCEHGYGLKNVQEILCKYDAEFAFEYKEGWFQFSALIPESKMTS